MKLGHLARNMVIAVVVVAAAFGGVAELVGLPSWASYFIGAGIATLVHFLLSGEAPWRNVD